jgi:hypothetical protein
MVRTVVDIWVTRFGKAPFPARDAVSCYQKNIQKWSYVCLWDLSHGNRSGKYQYISNGLTK